MRLNVRQVCFGLLTLERPLMIRSPEHLLLWEKEPSLQQNEGCVGVFPIYNYSNLINNNYMGWKISYPDETGAVAVSLGNITDKTLYFQNNS